MASISISIDESSGNQNNSTSSTANDFAFGSGSLSSLPPLFDAALATVAAGQGDPGVALSGYGTTVTATTNPNGLPIVSFGSNVTDVGFTDANGAALDGQLALDQFGHAIRTTDGTSIYLYTYSGDNNVVLGRLGNSGGTFDPSDDTADPNGAVVFAAYLDTGVDTGSSDPGATAAKVWLVQYQALLHPDATNPNDALILSNPLNIAVNNLLDFSLAGAPSGNNLFLMYGHPADPATTTPDVSLIVVSKDAATGGTVNSSQGGGGTTLGTDNQMVVPGKGLYFSYVTDANPDFTVPNLTHAEATTAADIQFGGLFGASGATFDVVQLQQDKAATLQISASNSNSVETGAAFVSGLNDADDTAININSVTVTRTVLVHKVATVEHYTFTESNNVAQDGLTVDFSGNTAVIAGLLAGDNVAYSTDTNHDRVLIDNVGGAKGLNASFDIGNFELTSGAITASPFQALTFVDSAPTAAAALGAGSVVNDETAGVQTAAGANDTTSATVAALFSGVTNTSTQLAAAEYAQGTASVIDSSAGVFGSDGPAASGATVYSLALASAGADSGLTDDAGTAILLYQEGGLVVGRLGSAAGAAAFAVSIDASTGVLSMAQYSAVKHADTSDPNDSTHITDTALQAVVTLTDGDGDTNSASVNIGNEVKILDDGPTAAAALGAGSVVNDETAGVQTAGGANDTASATVAALFSGVTNTSTQLAAAEYAQGTASVIDSSSSAFGVDGAAASNSTVYSLAVASAGVDSGLTNDAGTAILLYKEGGLVVGRIGSAAGAAAFAVSIDASSGVLSMAQYSAVKHADTTDPNDSVSITDTALQAVVTVKDGDGDTNTASVNIGSEVKILDDGPSLAFGNVIGTGAVDPQYGYWSMAPGSDGLGANGLNMTLDSFHLVKPDSTVVSGTSFTFSETSPSPDVNGAYHFSGSLTGDFDNNASTPDTTEHFTMTAYANGTYAIDLVEGFKSTTTESTANGTLAPGSPNAIKTLIIGSDNVEFFSTKPLASTSDIVTAIGLGAPDPDQSTLASGNYAAIDYTKTITVSTSGIGDANNLLQGDALAAIGSGDESITANPGTQFTSAKILIDNSVQGYSYTGGERMYYRLFYSDGTDSGQQLVTTDLGLANKGQATSFTADGGGKLIDAIQLTMATGTVKIPAIQFITLTNNLADGISLGFTSTIADGDGDPASSSFVTNMAANALGTSFDYVLNGITGKSDAFDIDLAPPENKYQVNGFETGTDKLVLLGANSYTIDTSTADSIVDVTETAGGQHTTVTVVGVHIGAADIATIV